MATPHTLSINKRPETVNQFKDEPKQAPVAPVEESTPRFDPTLKFIEIRDLSRTNIRYQQADNYFDKSKKFAGKADSVIPTKKVKTAEAPKEEKKVLVRDRGPRANGSSSAKVLSVSELRAQFAQKQAKKTASSTPEALLKAQRENRRVAAAEANAL